MQPTPGIVTLRPATKADIPTLQRWDHDPDVIAASSDDAEAEVAFDGHDWHEELAAQTQHYQYFVAELDGRPLGAMQIIDPYNEHSHYWGEIEPNLRAVDIWIGAAEDRGHGYGEKMMRLAFQRCFADPAVTAIVIDPLFTNVRAHKFYERIGFVVTGRQTFGDDDCLVMRFSRATWRQLFPNDGDPAG